MKSVPALALLCPVLAAACAGSPARVPSPSAQSSSGPASTPSASSPSASTGRPRAVPDVTLAYFRPWLGLVGLSPDCCGNQGTGRSRLWLTTDMRHWRDVTPPGSGQSRFPGDHPFFQDASFLNPTTGWVSTWDVGNLGITAYRISDGGRHWTALAAGERGVHAGSAARFQLLSPTTAYRQQLDPAGPVVELSVTHDAGVHWRTTYDGWTHHKRGHPFGPFERPVIFLSESRGFSGDVVSLADYPYDATGRLFETSDGGRTWTSSRPPLAGGGCRQTTGDSCVLALPTFFDASDGILPGAHRRGARTTISFDRTTDAGATWVTASSITLPDDAAGSPPCAVTCALASVDSASDWWVLSRGNGRYETWGTTDAGVHWSHHRSTARLPGHVVSLWGVSPTAAWAVTEVRTRAGTTRRLVRTDDGGSTWREVTPTGS